MLRTIFCLIIICLWANAYGQTFEFFQLKKQPHTLHARAFQLKAFNLHMPAPSETPLFDRIDQGFRDYRLRADEASARVLAGNAFNVVGGLSGVGFSLSNNFGGFSVNAYRQLAPEL